MKFIGFKPLFDNKDLPNFLKSGMGLFTGNTNTPLPCLINTVSITKEHLIPEEPVDSNVFVSDNIITKPLQISLDLYIYEQDSEAFYNAIHTSQHDKQGFVFVNRDGMVYNDLYLESISSTISFEKLGGFDCAVDLKQIMKVYALQSTIKLPEVKKAPLQNQGTVSTEKVSDSAKQAVENKSILYKASETVGGISDTLGNLLGIGA